MIRKNRTAPTPHRLVKQISLFLAPFENKGDLWVWSGSLDAGSITIQTKANLNKAIHSQLFHYALSIAETNKDKIARFNILDFMAESGRSVSRQTKKDALEMMMDLGHFEIDLQVGRKKVKYNIVDTVGVDSSTGEVHIRFGVGVDELFKTTKKRFVDISPALHMKRSSRAVELNSFLQSMGQGVGKYVKEFGILDVVRFLHLDNIKDDRSLNTIVRIIERDLKNLHKEGVPKYKRVKCLPQVIKWVKVA